MFVCLCVYVCVCVCKLGKLAGSCESLCLINPPVHPYVTKRLEKYILLCLYFMHVEIISLRPCMKRICRLRFEHFSSCKDNQMSIKNKIDQKLACGGNVYMQDKVLRRGESFVIKIFWYNFFMREFWLYIENTNHDIMHSQYLSDTLNFPEVFPNRSP